MTYAHIKSLRCKPENNSVVDQLHLNKNIYTKLLNNESLLNIPQINTSEKQVLNLQTIRPKLDVRWTNTTQSHFPPTWLQQDVTWAQGICIWQKETLHLRLLLWVPSILWLCLCKLQGASELYGMARRWTHVKRKTRGRKNQALAQLTLAQPGLNHACARPCGFFQFIQFCKCVFSKAFSSLQLTLRT